GPLGIEDHLAALLARLRDRDEVLAGPSARPDHVRDALLVELEMSTGLLERGVDDWVLDDNLGHTRKERTSDSRSVDRGTSPTREGPRTVLRSGLAPRRWQLVAKPARVRWPCRRSPAPSSPPPLCRAPPSSSRHRRRRGRSAGTGATAG